MKFAFKVGAVLPKLITVASVINAKNVISILQTVKFETGTTDDGVSFLSLTASDGNTTLTTSVAIENGCDKVSFCIAPKDFIRALSSLTEETVAIEVNGKGMLCAEYGKGNFSIPYMDASEYPSQNRLDDENTDKFKISRQTILDAISATSFAISNDELRPQFNGIYFDIYNDRIVFVATDTRKLSKYEIKCLSNVLKNGKRGFVLPSVSVALLSKMLPNLDDENIEVTFDNATANFATEDMLLSSRLVNGAFPNYEKVIPNYYTATAKIRKADFVACMGRASVFSSSQMPVARITFKHGIVNVVASYLDLDKTFHETFGCEYDGEEVTIGFSCESIISAVKANEDEYALVSIEESRKPAVIKPATQREGCEHTTVVMPVVI